MTAFDQISGSLLVRPGKPRPDNLLSSRPDWVDRLTRGKPASALPTILSSVFSLCGHAHRACASMAIAAASGQNAGGQNGKNGHAELRQAIPDHLRLETLREHVRRLFLDWPRQLSSTHDRDLNLEQSQRVLAHCPLFHLDAADPALPAATASALQDWMEEHVLGMPAATWLADWEFDFIGWLDAWAGSAHTPLAHLLRECKPVAHGNEAILRDAQPLRVHASEASLRELAECMSSESGFTRAPRWLGESAETGPWARLQDANPEAYRTPWLRLGARLAELVRLSLPDQPRRCGAQWLMCGSLVPQVGTGLAWVEMARGLLVHQVCVEGTDAGATIASCHVLAPTEWNFHPQGSVARALEYLPEQITPAVQHRVDVLMTAYDPCVRYELDPSLQTEKEILHA